METKGNSKKKSWMWSAAEALMGGFNNKENKMIEEEENSDLNSTTPNAPSHHHNNDQYPAVITGAVENSESHIVLESIKEDYLKLYKKFYSCDKSKMILLEFEEEFSRLIYRVDDIEPINDEIKQRRTQLIKTIQGMIDVVRKKTHITSAENEKEVKCGAFLPSILYENLKIKVEPMDCDVKLQDDKTSQDVNKPSTSQDSCQNVNLDKNIREQSYITGHPLQLLSFNIDTELFELDEDAVKSVLLQPELSNRKIAIVSIVGAFRRGKSFLLNFMLRYLNAKGSSDWLKQSDSVIGFSWRSGKTRNTNGILMWSKPFLIGEDLALVLLDTQGTFDNQTSMKENTFIFALSTLLSSVQIYNLHERIQMDDLSNLQYLLELGRLVQQANNTKVFENLVLLIRDWSSSTYEPGFQGGEKLLEEWLKMEHETVTRQKLELIETCFKQISCFLMPHPGKEATTGEFSGHLNDIKPNFLKHMKSFVENIVEGGILCGKQIGGEFVNAEQFLTYMKTCVDTLQHPDIEPKTLFQTLEVLHERFAHEFDHHADAILHEACSVAYDNFEETLNAFCAQLQPECILKDKCKEALDQAFLSLKNLKLNINHKKYENEITSMMKKMDNWYKIHEPIYKERQEQEKKHHMNLIKHEVLKCYQTRMDTECGGPNIVPQFEATHTQTQLKALEILNAALNKYNLHDYTDFISDINKEMDDKCEHYKLQNERKIKKEKEDKLYYHMMDTHHQAVETYRREMDFGCRGMKTVKNLLEIHASAFEIAINLYTPHEQEYGKEACHSSIYKTNQSILELHGQYTVINAEKQQQNTFERAGELQKAGLWYYEEQMGNWNIGIQTVPNLSDIHEKNKAEAMNKLKPVSTAYFYSKFMNELEEAIEKKYLLYVQQNMVAVVQKRMDEVKHAQEKCVNVYTEKMDALEIDQHPVEDLSEKHANFKEEALTGLRDFLTDEEGNALQNVAAEVEKKWLIYATKNKQITEMFKNEELRTVKCAYNDIKATYMTNMNKNRDACLITRDAAVLFKFHEKEKQNSLTNFREMTSECSQENTEKFILNLENDIQNVFEEVEGSLGISLRVLRMKEEELKANSQKNYAIGIDLGTTNSCAAVYRNGKVEMIYSDKLSDKNKTTTPSVVYFGEEEILFGETAVVKGFVDPKNCISEMKRIIGRRFDDPVVQSLIVDWPFDVSDSNEKPVIDVKYGMKKSYKPEEVSSLVLGEMKRIAEVYLGSQVHDAVVTIPAYFNGLQREATKAACVMVGLNVLRMINEPTAAAIAYGLQCQAEEVRTLLVFDFGGGTCDISIATVEGETFTVKASKGDNKLGGEDFDDRLTEHVAKIIEAKYNVKIDVKEKRRLRHNCERVKRNLTQDTKYVLQIEQFTDAKVDVEVHVERETFEKLNRDLFKRALIPVEECLNEANLSVEQIDEIVMVGGSSRMPKMRQMLSLFFNGKHMRMRINPDEAIAYGAAIQAAICTEEYIGNIHISEITPISLGISVIGNKMSIITPKNTKIPSEHTEDYYTVEDNQTTIRIWVYQGECTENEFKNTNIGKFNIDNLTPAPAGHTSILVTFTIDLDGILHIKVVEKGKKNNQKSVIITKNVL